MQGKISHTPVSEYNVPLSGEELVAELNRITTMPILPKCKLLLVEYLMQHYFAEYKKELRDEQPGEGAVLSIYTA